MYKKFLRAYFPNDKETAYVPVEMENDIRIYDKMDNLYEVLKPYGFGYPHNSYIINCRYIMSCNAEEIRLEEHPDLVFKVSCSKAVEFNSV